MYRLPLTLAAVVIVLDQITKWVILELVMQPPRIIEVTGFFNLVLTYNRGVSFGLLAGDADWVPYALSILAAVIVIVLLIWLRSLTERSAALAIGAVIGGAVGNVIDRLRFDAVVDFLDFHIAGRHWPAFNVADSAIVLGVAVLVLGGLFEAPKKGKR